MCLCTRKIIAHKNECGCQFVHVHVYVWTCVWVYGCVCVWIFVSLTKCVCLDVCVFVAVGTCMQVCMCACTLNFLQKDMARIADRCWCEKGEVWADKGGK